MSRWLIPEHYNVRIGGVTMIDCESLVEFQGKKVFSLYRNDNDGYLGIDFDLYDISGSKLATIRGSQIVGRLPNGYKVDGGPDHYILIEEGSGRVICELRLRGQADGQAEIQISGEMYMPNGKLLLLTPSSMIFGNHSLSNVVLEKTGGCAISLN